VVGSSALPRKWRTSAACDFRDRMASASVEDAVVRMVSELIDQVDCPPTDLDTICEKLGTSVRDCSELFGTGALVRHGGTLQILCASGLSAERRRFTIAHEIGHLVIEQHARRSVRQSKEVERLCDMFAAELLMPTSAFGGAVGKSTRLRDLPALARSFQVSLTSAAIRWAELRRISVFEVQGDRIVWGVGVIRRGRTHDLDDALRPVVARATAGVSGADQVYLNVRESIRSCEVEYWPLGKSGRALIRVRLLSTV
jgi:Zn-dependent peptidase ImmA (M78 family)